MRLRVLLLLSLLLLAAAWIAAARAADYNPAGYSFSSIDYTWAPMGVSFAGTGISGLNNLGQMVGGYGTWTPKKSQGLFYANQVFTVFNYPGSVPDGTTAGAGINDDGLLVGGYNLNVDDSGGNRGFLLNGESFTTLAVPEAQYNTTATDINNAGLIVGSYDFSSVPLVTHSFIYNGTYNTFSHPDFTSTAATGINANGLIVGTVIDSGGISHGFLLNGSTYTIIDYPGANQTNLTKINRVRDIAGFYTTGTTTFTMVRHGFVYSQGKFYLFDYPGAKWTMLTGISNNGRIAGTWVDSSYAGHGFVAVPRIAKNTLVPVGLLLD